MSWGVAVCRNSNSIWVKRHAEHSHAEHTYLNWAFFSAELGWMLTNPTGQGQRERDGEKEREIRIDYLFHKLNIKCWTQSPTGTLIKQRDIFIDSPLIPVPTAYRKNDKSLFLLGWALKGPEGKTFHHFNWSKRSLIKRTILNHSTKGRPFRGRVEYDSLCRLIVWY